MSLTKFDAIRMFGSVRKLADALGVSEQAVHAWGYSVPQLRAYQLQEIVGARISGLDYGVDDPQSTGQK